MAIEYHVQHRLMRTAYIERTYALLPLWKRTLHEDAGISLAYINLHICISKTDSHQTIEKDIIWFAIFYTLRVDWAQIEIGEAISFPKGTALTP